MKTMDPALPNHSGLIYHLAVDEDINEASRAKRYIHINL